MSEDASPSDDSSAVAIPEDAAQAPLFTLSASTVLSTLPTSATTILDHYSAPLLASPSSPSPSSSAPGPSKVTIRVRPIGAAPSLKQSTYRIAGSQEFHVLVRFLRKQLKCRPHETLFCYVNQSFAPALDEPLANLHANFAVDGHLQVSYCYTVAFG